MVAGSGLSPNVHNAPDWEELLLPEIERQQRSGKEARQPEIKG
jgi:hypothetical protein